MLYIYSILFILYKIYIYIYIYLKENSDSFTLYDYFIEWGTNREQEDLFMIIRGINNSS